MIFYYFMMYALVILEFKIENKTGLATALAFAVTILRFFLARFMAGAFDKEIRKGLHLEKPKLFYNLLSYAFVVDMIGNIVLMVPFPTRFTVESYNFFLIITIIEVIFSTLAFCFYMPKWNGSIIAPTYLFTNLIIVVELIRALFDNVESYSAIVLLLFIVIRICTNIYGILMYKRFNSKGIRTAEV